MGQPFPLLSGVTGMVRDAGRADLPGGAAWNVVDFIPGLQAPLRKRGGWSYASNALGAASSVSVAFNAEFTAGTKFCSVASDNNLYTIASQVPTSIGALGFAVRSSSFHRSTLILPDAAGASAPKYYDGTTLATLGGTPPAGIYGATWKDRSMLANASGSAQRLWFSSPGNPQSWDTSATGLWYDTTGATVGLAPLRNTVIVFHSGLTERLRGDPPPGSTLVLEVLAPDVGCADNRSIVVWEDTAVWADTKGVYQSDGTQPIDLTARGGIKNYWQDVVMANYTTSYVLAGTMYRNHYIVSITNGSSLIDCLAYDFVTRGWYRFSNFPFRCFARVGSGAQEEAYAGLANAGRVSSLSSCWQPSASVKNDADGTSIQPLIETAAYRGWLRFHRRWIQSLGTQNWRRAYLDYDVRDAAADAPILQLGYLLSPEATSYTTLTPSLSATTKRARQRLLVNQSSPEIAFKIQQVGPSADTRIYALEADYFPREGSRLS